MNLTKKHLIVAGLTIIIILTILFNLGDITSKEIAQYIPPSSSQSQTAAVSDFIVHNTFDTGTVTGAIGQATTFDGIDDYVTLSSSGVPVGKQPVTVSAWVKLAGSPSADSRIVFRGERYSSSDFIFFDLALEGAGHNVPTFTMMGTGGGGSHYKATSGTGLSAGQWYHLVGVSDGGGAVTVYVNNTPTTGSHIDFDGHDGTPYAPSVGARLQGSADSFFAGSIDDVRIYNRALDSSEVSQLYALGSGGGTPAPTPDPTPTPTPDPTPTPSAVNGQCGVTENICIQGTLNNTADSTTNYLWQCTGANGGATGSCSIAKPVNTIVTPPSTPDPVTFTAPPVVSGSQTYYIDYVSGNNANNGTSKNTPWKVHPYMKGFTGSYSHKAGDRFIFKGGVTWPHSAFQMNIAAGGSSDSARDYYGADKTWYAGSSWTRPVFDFENKVVAPDAWGGAESAGLLLRDVHYITLDNLELIRFRQRLFEKNSGKADPGFAVDNITIQGSASNITLQNSIVRDWTIPTPIPAGYIDGGASGGVIVNAWSGGGTGIKILNNEFHQQNTGIRSGVALYLGGEIAYNTIHHVSDAIVGGGNVHDNLIYNVEDATCPELHEDVIYITSPSTVYNNVVYEATAAAPVYYLEPSRSASTGTTLVYNNISYNTGYAPLSIDISQPEGVNHVIKVYNNSFHSESSSVVRVVDRVGLPLGVLDMKNNHFIFNGQFLNIPAGTVLDFKNTNNIFHTESEAAQFGATRANLFKFTSSNAPMINAGVSLSTFFATDRLGVARPQGGAWDIGAYEYGGSGGSVWSPPPPAPVYKQGDFNRDGLVNSLDLSLLTSVWNQNSASYDLNSDGIVNSLDYVVMIQNWTS